jgi:hypothetical protein
MNTPGQTWRQIIAEHAAEYAYQRLPSQWDRIFAKADEPIHRWEDDGGGPR